MARDSLNIDPELLAELDLETSAAEASKRNKYMPRVNVERGHSWLIRFLPVTVSSTSKLWLGRFAQHWLHKKPIICKKKTGVYYGGDDKHDCPICSFVEQGLAASSEKVVKRAEECFAELRWNAMCLVWKKDLGRGAADVGPNEYLVAHEFNMYRPVFDQVRLFLGRNSSLADFELGQDIWVQRTGRGTQLQAEPVEAIAKPADMEETIAKIWSTIIMPKIEIPTSEEENEFYQRVVEFIKTGGGAPSAPTSNRGRGSSSAGDLDEAQFEHDSPPVRQAPRQETPPSRQAAPAPRLAAQPAPPARQTPPPPSRQEAPPARQTPPPPPSRQATPAPRPELPALRPVAPPTVPKPLARLDSTPKIGVESDDDLGVANEETDPAPPVAEAEFDPPVAAETAAPAAPAPPPPLRQPGVTAPAPITAPTKLGQAMADRLKNAGRLRQ